MSATFAIDYESAVELQNTIQQYQEGAEGKINRYLHGKGYDMFDKAIHNAMPESGRKWRGKKAAAKSAKSLQDKNTNENLAITIRSASAYGYLYFPDDGSNTIHHYGNQQFFERGVESQADRAINDILDELKL